MLGKPVEVRVELRGEALGLALVHAQQPERWDQLAEMGPRRRRQDQCAVGRSTRASSGPLRGAKDAQRQGGHAIAQRQRTPGVAGHRGDTRMGSRSPAQGVLGEVERQPGSIGQPLQDQRRYQPVPAPRSITQPLTSAATARSHSLCIGLGQQIEVPGAEKCRTSADHRHRVRAAELGVSRQEAEVALRRATSKECPASQRTVALARVSTPSQ